MRRPRRPRAGRGGALRTRRGARVPVEGATHTISQRRLRQGRSSCWAAAGCTRFSKCSLIRACSKAFFASAVKYGESPGTTRPTTVGVESMCSRGITASSGPMRSSGSGGKSGGGDWPPWPEGGVAIDGLSAAAPSNAAGPLEEGAIESEFECCDAPDERDEQDETRPSSPL